MGDGIASGDVLKILVAVGDVIEENQTLVELETDKAVVEVPSTESGTVEKVHIREGDTVPTGAVLVTVSGSAAPAAGPVEHIDPDEAEPIVAAPPAAAAAAPPAAAAAPAASAAAPSPASSNGSGALLPAGPAARRISRELGVDLGNVQGSGKHGRITIEDVQAAAAGGQSAVSQPGQASGGIPVPALPDFGKWGPVRREAMSKVRRLTADAMAVSWQQVPRITQFERIDITELEEFRGRHKEHAKELGSALTMTVFVIKAVLTALKRYPQFNASIDMAAGEVIYKDYYHIGMAVDTDRGLLVPSLRNADRMDIFELGAHLKQTADEARSGKIDPELLSGSTFTISNQGGIGGLEFTPIIAWPQVSILGIGQSRLEPAVVNGQIAARLMMPIGVSYDHRVIDGASAARFVDSLKKSLENPEGLLLGG
jgi:pyruvate dehydrogenase E2 component (dihydrolipoamide acetyltransferase)